MAVFAPGDTPDATDSAWRTRIPQGWIQFPDGSIGPPNTPSPIDQGWPTRTPQPPGAVPNVGGTPTPPPQGALAPGSFGNGGASVDSNGALIPQSPSGGTTLNTTGPEIIPPNSRPIPPNRSVGPFTGGTATDASPDIFAGGEMPWWLKMLPGNRAGQAAITAAATLAPTPTANDAAPTNMWNQRPSGVGGMPGPQVTNPQDPSILPQARGVAVPPDTSGILPQARGVAVPPNVTAPSRRINPARVNLGQGAPGLTAPVQAPANSPFIGIDRPNSGPNERNRGSPQATALDLSALFSHPAVAAAAAAHPAVQAAGRAISPTTGQPMPMSTADINYGLPDARGAPYPYALGRKTPRTSSTSSQGGGY